MWYKFEVQLNFASSSIFQYSNVFRFDDIQQSSRYGLSLYIFFWIMCLIDVAVYVYKVRF